MDTGLRKASILFYSDCPFFGGCENMLAYLLDDPLVRQNFTVTFVYRYSKTYQEGLHARIKLNIDARPLRLPSVDPLFNRINSFRNELLRNLLKAVIVCTFIKYVFFIYSYLWLFFIFRKIKPDILHINNGGYPGAYSCIAAVFAAKLARIKKVVFVVNNMIVPYRSFSRYIDKPIDSFVKNNVTVFVTGSKTARDSLCNLWGLQDKKAVNIPNTVLPRIVSEPRESVLKRLGLSDGLVILGNIAILERRKGQEYLIEALATIREKYDNFRNIVLVIVGTGSESEHLKEMVAVLNLKEHVFFLKSDRNIFNIINIFDVFVLSSIEYEDFPFVILEAMSMGKPVIGTRLAGIPEQINNGINGFIVNPKDSNSLAQAILTLAGDHKKRTEMGVNSYSRFNELFSYDKVINRYMNLYKEMESEN